LFTKAGLFSAVLTAFLVESYQSLSPDTPSQMLVVMQQVSTQMTSFNTPFGMINSTYQPLLPAPPTGEQPFEPSSSDIRVNVLWFASLVFSLVTASFGILVKQWLREYLAVKNPSPQARLRIRHFRNPELEKWMVVEIAAILPLLQQLSLALFFIGLCYFTESVHSSIGRTTLPLVAGWAFCFTTVTILPLFFPRCPYKTALLKRLLISIHLRVARSLCQLSKWLYSASDLDGECETALGNETKTTSGYFTQLLSEHIERSDEQAILASEAADLEILAEVDAVQSNDELLGTVIFDSLQQIHYLDYHNGIQFVVHALGHRLSREDFPCYTIRAPFNLRGLSQSGYNTIIDILIYFMKAQELENLFNSKAGIFAFSIIFAPSRFPLPPSGIDFLQSIIEKRYTWSRLVEKLVKSCTMIQVNDNKGARSHYMYLVRNILHVLETLDVEFEISLATLESALNAWFCRSPDCFPLEITFAGNWEGWSSTALQEDKVLEFFSLAIERTLSCFNAEPQASIEFGDQGYTDNPATSKSSGHRLSDMLCAMYYLIAVVENQPFKHEVLRRTVLSCLATKESTIALLDAVRRVDVSVFLDYHDQTIGASFVSGHPLPIHIANMIECLQQYQSTSQTYNSKPFELDHALRLLCFCTNLTTGATFTHLDNGINWMDFIEILENLTCQSLLAVYSRAPTLAQPVRRFDIRAIAYYSAKLQRSHPTSAANCSRAAEQCLLHLQSVAYGPPPISTRPQAHVNVLDDLRRLACRLTFRNYHSFVQMLAVIYFASSGANVDNSKWSELSEQTAGVQSIVHDARAAIRRGKHAYVTSSSTPGILPTVVGNNIGNASLENTPAAAMYDDGALHHPPPLPIAPTEEVLANESSIDDSNSNV
jgi:hypothetical protein